MNVAIIGAGNISETHARAAAAAGLTVRAVFGDNRDKTRQFAERHGATPFDTLDGLLRGADVGLVMIGSPSGCHAEQALAAVRGGRHVLVEKPLDINTARIDPLLAAVRESGVTLGLFFQDRLKPDILALKQALASGAIGEPVLVSGDVKWYRPPEYYTGSRWRGTAALDGGGALMNQGIHTVDLMLYLLGPITRVRGSIATRLHAIESEDTAAAVLEFESGALGTLAATTAAPPGRPRRLEIIGTAGALVLEGDRLVTSTDDTSSPAPENAASPVVSDVSAHQRIIEDFVAAVREGRPPVCDGHEGRRSVEVVEAVYRSARERQAIDVDVVRVDRRSRSRD
jgi:UDP-N-acetyl-2-amino-2-deoxyglucuronate dehydrogenase